MRVEFKSTKLKKRYESIREGERAWGNEVARRYVERIGILYNIREIDDLKSMPQLKYHPLTGNRQGQHAITLISRWRLVFTLEGVEQDTIRIEEVSKHYGD
ncbi:MAG: hypothetical protein B1H03_00930 [Planctomycetales bacterium 4484_113]|nr:MAG: hypothetical protein B1H03_00930 [Planctomycetales bacterium 4484_113]